MADASSRSSGADRFRFEESVESRPDYSGTGDSVHFSFGSGLADDLEGTARSYLRFRLDHDASEGPAARAAVEDWGRSVGADSISVRIFCDLHLSDPTGALGLAKAVSTLPDPGDEFLGFRVIEELGRGAFGRVYLALQGDLADRPVALKVSASLPGESQTLAQLQHTNIVPIFSEHRSAPFYAVCMPYFGATTLSDLVQSLGRRKDIPDSGTALLTTLASRPKPSGLEGASRAHPSGGARASIKVGDGGPRRADTLGDSDEMPTPLSLLTSASETLRMLGGLSYVEAVLWLVARLADGLDHAHGRGILHRDLKPANILLTDDGQPMLLDFNLSIDTKLPAAAAASVGGTLPYMAPEHVRAFLGEDEEVDGRCDLYSLGVIMFELLTGRHPFADERTPSIEATAHVIARRQTSAPALRTYNHQVSPAVQSIVCRLLEPDPARRYLSARALREDIDRHLAHRPLLHAPEPWGPERFKKWVRRHPRLAPTIALAASLLVTTALAAGFLVRGRRMALHEARLNRDGFNAELDGLRTRIDADDPTPQRRREGRDLGLKALDRYAVLKDPDGWKRRRDVVLLDPSSRDELGGDIGETLLLLALATTPKTDPNGALKKDEAAAAKEALNYTRLAESYFPPGRLPPTYWEQRAKLVKLLGRDEEALALRVQASAARPRTARDYYLSAISQVQRGDYERALPLAERATQLSPQDFWAWFWAGHCYDNLGRDSDAMACFTTCVALRPDYAFAWYNRGTAELRRRKPERARYDFGRAIELNPNWYEPYLNRAEALTELGKPAEAAEDLTRALEHEGPEVRLLFMRSNARKEAGDLDGSKRDFEAAMAKEPTDDMGYVARASARYPDDPKAALADLEKAEALNPKSLSALQNHASILSDMPERIDEAIALHTKILGLFPDAVEVRSGRGVLFARKGKRDEALRDAQQALLRDTRPVILYQVAGIYATTSKQVPDDRFEAFRLLNRALREGFGFEYLDIDPELDAVRDVPEFRALVAAARERAGIKAPPADTIGRE